MKCIDLSEAEDLFEEDLEVLQQKAFEERCRNFGKGVTFYKKPFTPVSITRHECALSCKHCNKHYLTHMHPVSDSVQLERVLYALKETGVNGIVLSGGCMPDGSVPIYEFKDTLRRLKDETGLKINAHTGIVGRSQAQMDSEFLDFALTDVIGDKSTISEILGLDYSPEDYLRTIKNLHESGVKLSPHIIAGLHYGEIRGELKALDMLSAVDPKNIVIVCFIPTEGTAMADCDPPRVEDVAKLTCIARLMYPDTHVSLSCVRPGGRYRLEVDREALKSGATKISVPSKAAYLEAEKLGLQVNEISESRCCSC